MTEEADGCRSFQTLPLSSLLFLSIHNHNGEGCWSGYAQLKGQNEILRISFCLISRVVMLVRIFTKYHNHPAPINKVMVD